MKTASLQATQANGRFRSTSNNFVDEIQKKKSIINHIKSKHLQKLEQANIQIQQLQVCQRPRSSTFHAKNQNQFYQTSNKKIKVKQNEEDLKNPGVNDTDKMIYEKKFKNFLNYRQQYQRKARQRIQKIKKLRKDKQDGLNQINQDQFFNKDELLNDKGNQNQFQNAVDMLAAYQQITTGKRQKKDRQLFHAQKIQYLFRRQEFDYIILLEQAVDQRDRQNQLPTLITSISKEALLNYLFDQPSVMMLYSINPYQLGDQLTQFETEIKGELTFEQFSKFLLLDRQPTYFEYSQQNMLQARKLGRGIKCMPIIAKWVEDEDLFGWLIEIFKEIDIMGENKAQKQILAKKIRKQAEKKLILNRQVIQIVNINKFITLDRILYELQYSVSDSQKITYTAFQSFLKNYKRLRTPQKDKLIKKLILSGKYDPSYMFILNSQALQIIKQVFDSLQKFAQYFVPKQKFVERLVKHSKFNKIRNSEVRSQTNRYVRKQTVQETLVRFLNEAENQVDIEQVLDFFTNRGRPTKVQHTIYMMNLQMQIQRIEQEQRRKQEKKLSHGDFSTSSDDEQFEKRLKQKKIQRKKDKLLAIRQSQNFQEGKKFQITVPLPFSFSGENKMISIRQKKLAETLNEKRRLEDQAMKPIKPKQVPNHVKENLFEKIMRDQQRQRKQRLERFRIQSMQKMIPVSQTLFKKRSPPKHDYSVKHDKFIARPLPWYCEVNLLQRIIREKQQRRQRILEEVINRHSEYDVPEKVKQMLQRQQKAIQNKKKLRSMSKTTADVQCQFIPKISQGVPDFRSLHENLQTNLQIKKQQKKPIKIQPFSFQNRPTRSRTALQPKKGQNIMKGSKNEFKNANEQVNIPITKKYEAFVNLRHQQSRQKSLKEQQQKKADAIRKMRHQKFAPYVREVLRHNQYDPSKSRSVIQQKIRQFKREQRKKKAEYEEEMLKIYTKVFSRPLLIQSSGVQSYKYPKNQSRKYQESLQKERKSQMMDKKGEAENYAEDYEYKAEQQYSKRFNPQNEQLRRKAIEHPPRNYLMQQPQDHDQQEYEQGQQGEYLSENGRYTN